MPSKASDIATDWQRLFTASPQGGGQLQRPPNTAAKNKNRGKSAGMGLQLDNQVIERQMMNNTHGPGIFNQRSQLIQQRGSTQVGQSRFHAKEEKDLQKALLSIQSFANNNLRDSFSVTMPVTPSQFNSTKPPKLSELARLRKPQDQQFNFIRNAKQPSADNLSKRKLLSPIAKDGLGIQLKSSIHQQRSSLIRQEPGSSHSRSRSPIEEDQLFQEQQRQGDLQLTDEISNHVRVNNLLINNNYSAMLKHVEKVKNQSDLDHKVLKNVKLVSTLQSHTQDKIQKRQNHKTLQQFVEITDAAYLKPLIPKPDAWQINTPAGQSHKVKIHTSELTGGTMMTTSTTLGVYHQRKLSDIVTAKSVSPTHRPGTVNMAVRNLKSKGSQLLTRGDTKINDEDRMHQFKEDQDKSYELYLETLQKRVSMQQMISQNIIKVNLVKEGSNSHSYQVTSNQSRYQVDSTERDAYEERPQEQLISDEAKYIVDFISERDQFIQRHKKKSRLIFSYNQDDNGNINVVEIGQLPLQDFLKSNRINPRVYTCPTDDQLTKPDKNKKQYYLQKSVHLIQTQKLPQARTFLMNAVREYPEEVSLSYNKGLVHYLMGEYKEATKIYYQLINRLHSRNLVLINLFLCHLMLREYERVIDLQKEIEKKDDFLDQNEKQLRMMGLIAKEKLKIEDYPRYQAYIKQKRQQKKEVQKEIRIESPGQQEGSAIRIDEVQTSQMTFQMKQENNDTHLRYANDFDDKEITIVDEHSQRERHNDDTLNMASIDDVVHFNQSQSSDDRNNEGSSSPVHLQIPAHHTSKAMQSNLSANRLEGLEKSQRVQFSQEFNNAFERFESNIDHELFVQQAKKEDSIETGADENIVILVDAPAAGKDANNDRGLQADIGALKKDVEGEDNLIKFIEKHIKRKNGSTKVIMTKREEFFLKKYKRVIQELADPDGRFYYLTYLKPEENMLVKRRTTIKIDPKVLMQKDGPLLESEEEKLMKYLGMPKEKIEERMQKHKMQLKLTNQVEGGQTTKKTDAEKSEFTTKTQDFIHFLFEEYGLKEVIVPGSDHAPIFQDIRNIEQLNAYVNKLSEFMTPKTIYLANDKQKMQNEDDIEVKKKEKTKKYELGFDSEPSDVDLTQQEQAEVEETPQNQLESFQNVLEIKVIDLFSGQNYEEANFYSSLLQKLNTIDLLQLFLRNCARKIKSGEKLLTFKKELSFGMLQIFREQVSKKELNTRREKAEKGSKQLKVDYDMIDKTVRRLRFFKNFAIGVRYKLYEIAKYEIVPPGRVIAHQEEFESHIFVIISGLASLTVKYLETNEAYSGMLIYPGDAFGDANIKDKIVISKGRGEAKTFLSSVKECDVLVFERRMFTDVLFKDMMDSLYEKIICMRNSEFFESLSPYAMVILCSNVELQEYSYGDVILRQESEPEECYIIISGECKLVLETVIYKPQEEKSAKKQSSTMKFGKQIYNPSELYGDKKKAASHAKMVLQEEQKGKLINQRKLNEKFSFQHEKLDFPEEAMDRSNSPIFRAPVINNTEVPFSEQKHGSKMIAYRHHLFYDKLSQGKVLCSRALLERDYAKKFIVKKIDYFREQLDITQSRETTPKATKSKFNYNFDEDGNNGMPLNDDYFSPAVARLSRKETLKDSTLSSNHHGASLIEHQAQKEAQQKAHDLQCEHEAEGMYETLMKSQLTVIADQASVKVLKLTRKSKKYLSDPLKAMIDNKIYDTKFKDYDRPFKNELEVQKFIEGQRKWEHYKDRLSKQVVMKYVYK